MFSFLGPPSLQDLLDIEPDSKWPLLTMARLKEMQVFSDTEMQLFAPCLVVLTGLHPHVHVLSPSRPSCCCRAGSSSAAELPLLHYLFSQ